MGRVSSPHYQDSKRNNFLLPASFRVCLLAVCCLLAACQTRHIHRIH